MQPNNPYQPAPTGIDYLNHIAPPPPPTGFDKKSKIIMIIAGAIGLLSLIFIVITAVNLANAGPSPLAVAARLQKLGTLSSEYGDKLRTTALRDANSSLSTILITANRSIAEPLTAQSIDLEKQAKEIAALEPTEEIGTMLDDAHLNGRLDDAYAREMTYQLEDTLVMMKRLEQTTRSQGMKVFLEKTIADFETLKKQFAEATRS